MIFADSREAFLSFEPYIEIPLSRDCFPLEIILVIYTHGICMNALFKEAEVEVSVLISFRGIVYILSWP